MNIQALIKKYTPDRIRGHHYTLLIIIIGVFVTGVLYLFLFHNKGDDAASTLVPQNSDMQAQTAERPYVSAAIEHLSDAARVSTDDIRVVSVAESTWKDSCLGIPVPGETCDAGTVRGYRIVLDHSDSTFTYRTDRQGDIVREE